MLQSGHSIDGYGVLIGCFVSMSTKLVLESFMGRNSCSGHWINLATSEAGTINPSTPGFSQFVLLWSLVLCVCFVDRCLTFCTFFLGHRVVCPSVYGFWLPLWYIQTLLKLIYKYEKHLITFLQLIKIQYICYVVTIYIA